MIAALGLSPRVGLAFARNSFLRLLSYRVRYVVGVANYFLYVSVHYYLMRAVLEANPRAVEPLLSPADLVTYFSVGWAARAAYHNEIDGRLAEQVASGELAMELIRPAAYPWIKYSEAAGESLFRVFFMSLPIFAVLAAVYHPLLRPPAGAGHLGLSLVSLVLAFHIYFAVNLLTGLIAVATLKIQGFLWAKFLLVQLLSGVMLPFAIFPAWAQPWLARSPFAALGHTPVLLYQGKLTGMAAFEALALEAGWTALLLALCAWAWSRARRHIIIQGG